jgi:hypothetical protein
MRFFIFIISIFLFTNCSHNINEIKNGMSTSEVEKILGKPNSSSSSSSSSSINGDTTLAESSAEWSYTGKGTINFENDKVVSVSEKK